MWRIVRYMLPAVLAGCATTPPPVLNGPDYLDDGAEPVMVLGYFTEPSHLGMASCPDDGDSGMVIDCFGPYPKVTLVVREVIFGRLPKARLELLAFDVEHAARFPLGGLRPVLAYPENVDSEGQGVLGQDAFQVLFKTRAGEWAIPVGAEFDMPRLPCDAEEFLKPHPIAFANPQPTRALDEYDDDDIEELEANRDVTIRNGEVHFRAGVLLAEIYALRERLPGLPDSENMYIDSCLRK